MRQLHKRAFLIGIGLGIALGITVGFVIGVLVSGGAILE